MGIRSDMFHYRESSASYFKTLMEVGKPNASAVFRYALVDPRRFELLASAVQKRRSAK